MDDNDISIIYNYIERKRNAVKKTKPLTDDERLIKTAKIGVYNDILDWIDNYAPEEEKEETEEEEEDETSEQLELIPTNN